MHLFQTLPDEFFRPLTGKNKAIYVDCLLLMYQSFRAELSFGVDREIIVAALEQYFELNHRQDVLFEADADEYGVVTETGEWVRDARSKANAVLLRLKACGWLEYESVQNYRIHVNLYDYAVTMIEAFLKINKNEDMEFEVLISQIHATLHSDDFLQKPYSILRRVAENTEELIVGLKKLNTNIKTYIERLTNHLSANELMQHFSEYQQHIGSRAYHRLKTSQNIARFRPGIRRRLAQVLEDQNLRARALAGVAELEQLEEPHAREECLQTLVRQTDKAFVDLHAIEEEIDRKHARYLASAVARAKFLLTNVGNTEGKLAQLLQRMAVSMDADEELDGFELYPQQPLDGESLYVPPALRKVSMPQPVDRSHRLSAEQRAAHTAALQERQRNRFTRKHIEAFLREQFALTEGGVIRASALPLASRRDLIRIIYVRLYGYTAQASYRIVASEQEVVRGSFRFQDFLIERKEA